MTLNELIAKLQKVKRQANGSYLSLCPSHADKNPSLHITQKDDRLLLECFAGCDTESICQAIGITLTDLFLESQPVPQKKTIVATYDYQDESGQFLFQVVRYDPKSFAQRHKNGFGEWVWNMKDIRRVLYHLPDILLEPSTIYFVEGEKDADKLWEYGQVATTSPGGAEAWQPKYADYLIGKRVVVIPDKDNAGLNYARAVVQSLESKAKEVRCIILPGNEVKDFSDWIVDNDIAELPSLEQDVSILFNPTSPAYRFENESIIWDKFIIGQKLTFKAESLKQERTGIHARISILLNGQLLNWSYFNIERQEDRTRLSRSAHTKFKDYFEEELRTDLDLFCSGLWGFSLSTLLPELMVGIETDEPLRFLLFPYLLEGGGSILFAPPGRGKSQSALVWAVSIDAGISSLWTVIKSRVLFINLERDSKSLRRRLANINKALGLPSDRPLLTLNARGKSLADVVPAIRKAIIQYKVEVIMLDSISRAGLGDLNDSRTGSSLVDTLSSLCPTWLALGHTPRASEEHLIGSIMADAGADIVIQLRSQASENKLGIGYEITKANDLPPQNQQIFAFEFEGWHLKSVKRAGPSEFPDIEAKTKINMLDAITEFIINQDSGDASATMIAKDLGYNRVNISSILNARTDKFLKTRKVKTSQFYGAITHLV